jgi:hypothetical protein
MLLVFVLTVQHYLYAARTGCGRQGSERRALLFIYLFIYWLIGWLVRLFIYLFLIAS